MKSNMENLQNKFTRIMLFSSMIKKSLSAYCEKANTTKEFIEQEMDKLYLLAFLSLDTNKFIFTKKDLDSCKIAAESHSLKFGFISQNYSYNEEEDQSDTVYMYSFNHKSLQQYFIAVYVGKLTEEKRKDANNGKQERQIQKFGNIMATFENSGERQMQI